MTLTREQLIADGCVRNINMPAPGRLHCRICASEQPHHAYSHKGSADCYEVCTACGCYSGRTELRGAPPCAECKADVENDGHAPRCSQFDTSECGLGYEPCDEQEDYRA